MARYEVFEDAWCPVMMLGREAGRYDAGIELTDAERLRVERAFSEFHEVQRLLEERFQGPVDFMTMAAAACEPTEDWEEPYVRFDDVIEAADRRLMRDLCRRAAGKQLAPRRVRLH